MSVTLVKKTDSALLALAYVSDLFDLQCGWAPKLSPMVDNADDAADWGTFVGTAERLIKRARTDLGGESAEYFGVLAEEHWGVWEDLRVAEDKLRAMLERVRFYASDEYMAEYAEMQEISNEEEEVCSLGHTHSTGLRESAADNISMLFDDYRAEADSEPVPAWTVESYGPLSVELPSVVLHGPAVSYED